MPNKSTLPPSPSFYVFSPALQFFSQLLANSNKMQWYVGDGVGGGGDGGGEGKLWGFLLIFFCF